MKKKNDEAAGSESSQLNNLPKEQIDFVTLPISRFFKIEAASGVVLLLFAILAMYLANSSFSKSYFDLLHVSISLNIGSYAFGRSLLEWINDAAMTLFFFLIALELKRELVIGELNNPKVALLSISAAIGGMLVPALIYLSLQYGETGQQGWGTVMATDTAFVLGCLALLGNRIPRELRVFMLSLAIVDDIGAIMVVALGYGSQIDWLVILFALGGVTAIKLMAMLGIRSLVVYFIAGSFIWLAIDASGIHATVTGVILGLMTPTTTWVSDERLQAIFGRVMAYPSGDHWSGDTPDRKALKTAEAAARETLSPIERLEMLLHPWVGFLILPLFAFANAGIPFSANDFTNPITIAVFIGFVLGKPLGIFLFSWLAIKLGWAILPPNLRCGKFFPAVYWQALDLQWQYLLPISHITLMSLMRQN